MTEWKIERASKRVGWLPPAFAPLTFARLMWRRRVGVGLLTRGSIASVDGKRSRGKEWLGKRVSIELVRTRVEMMLREWKMWNWMYGAAWYYWL